MTEDNVVRFPGHDNEPHATGHVACWNCGREWQAVWPTRITTRLLQCECGAHVDRPPATDEEAIRYAVGQIASASAELSTLAGRVSGETRTVAQRWAAGAAAASKMLEGYLGRDKTNQVIAGHFRKHGELLERQKLGSRLYRMTTKDLLKSHPDKKGYYILPGALPDE